MAVQHADSLNSVRLLETPDGKRHKYFFLGTLAESGFNDIARLPVIIRILLESVLRNRNGTSLMKGGCPLEGTETSGLYIRLGHGAGTTR
jgi:aconitate hydratase